MREAMVIATVKPANMATPPSLGMGVVWTSRERTGVSALDTRAT